MIVYVVDDEKLARELLLDAIKECISDAEIHEFGDAMSAIEFSEKTRPDIVFTDINMPEINGLDFAKRLKSVNSKVNIVFVTGYSQYAMEAVNLHASGYVTKPITAKKVQEELNNLLYPVDRPKSGVYVHTFGNFDLLVDGEAVKFRREKSKELLALLIDRGRESLSNERIATYLYPESEYDSKAKNQITTIIADLRKTLEEVNAENILIKKWGQLQLNPDNVRCDAYDYWAGEPYAINLFKGEYMENYSWSEDSKAKFYWNAMK